MCDRLSFGSLLVVPLRSWRTRFGALTIISASEGGFGSEHQEVLRLLAGILTSRLDLAEQLQARQLLLTENAIAIATLRESEARFRNAFDHSGIGMALMASDGRLLKVNAALSRTVGYSQQELLLLNHQAITHPDDLGLDVPFVERMLAGEITSYELEKRYVHKSGSVVWGLLTISNIKSTAQQPLYFIAQIQDITARKETEDALKRLAIRDDLTGLYNRREMVHLLKEETSRADRHHRSVSLIMLDIDAFKKVNDTYGHLAGDKVLQQIARTIEDSVRSFDRVARYGGEEFAVILPETAGADALIVAERIRVRVASQLFPISHEHGIDVQIPLTISSGFATITAGREKAMEDLIREADEGLYMAKHAGRNRCVGAASALAAVQEVQPA
jgi:diguanylate cyclase (GGDEF)-like protein/PAS domain S-box-containing protein